MPGELAHPQDSREDSSEDSGAFARPVSRPLSHTHNHLTTIEFTPDMQQAEVELSDRQTDKSDVPQHDIVEHAELPSESGGELPVSSGKADIEGRPAEERVTGKAMVCVFVRCVFEMGISSGFARD